jgi:hypothetical protein
MPDPFNFLGMSSRNGYTELSLVQSAKFVIALVAKVSRFFFSIPLSSMRLRWAKMKARMTAICNYNTGKGKIKFVQIESRAYTLSSTTTSRTKKERRTPPRRRSFARHRSDHDVNMYALCEMYA